MKMRVPLSILGEPKDREDELERYLLWLRNHYDTTPSDYVDKATVLRCIDKVLAKNPRYPLPPET